MGLGNFGGLWGRLAGGLRLHGHALEYLLGDPVGYLRNDSISRRVALAMVGSIQSEGNPMIARDSGPVSHLTPSVLFSNENLTTDGDAAVGLVGRKSMDSRAIRGPREAERASRWRYAFHWPGVK